MISGSDSDQMSLSGIPQDHYPISIYCGRCGHMAELTVGIEVYIVCSGYDAASVALAYRISRLAIAGADLGG